MLSEKRVIIVGAGPVGLSLALMLTQQNIPVVVLETNAGPITDYRASTFHPPTLEMLEPSGLTDWLLTAGLKCRTFQYRDRNEGLVAEFDLGMLKDDTSYPYRLACEQFKFAAHILERLQETPLAEIYFSHTVTAVFQDASGVQTVQVSTPDGEKQFKGAWLIGADGGRSVVRKSLNIKLEGLTYPESFVVAGTQADFRELIPDIGTVNYIADADEWIILLKIPDVWRFITPVRGVSDEEALSDEFIYSRLQGFAPRTEGYRIEMRSVYRVHQRVAETFRRGRAFLVGDAAHLNNPIGGMGLNSGLHDAVDLARRLAAVWHGKAAESLMDSYEKLRKPIVVNGLLAQTAANKSSLEERDPAVRRATIERWRAIAADPRQAYEHMLRTSMIGPLRDAAKMQA